jgi:hypothetical protein
VNTDKKTSFAPDIPFWIVSLCLIGFILYFFVIEPMSHRHGIIPSPASRCINNLRQIDAAANEFALEHSKTNGEAINYPDDLTSYIKLNKDGKIPPCPSGGIYRIKKVGDVPTCSLGTTVTPAHVLP